MDAIDPYVPTGRTFPGPVVSLAEMQDPSSGHLATALVYEPPLAEHPAFSRDLPQARPFLESPAVTGLAELDAWDRDQGAFVYPTGMVWSLAELIRVLRDNHREAGLRAGLELIYVGALILDDAVDQAEPSGLYAHRSLDPWRVFVQPDGEVMILGWGLPPVAYERFLDADKRPPDGALRYAPPERLAGQWQDVHSDLFSLTMVGIELILGEALYDGLGDELLTQVERGDAKHRLYRVDALPREAVDVLGEAIDQYADSRYASPDDYIGALRNLLQLPAIEGPTLAEVVGDVARRWRRKVPLSVAEPERASPAPREQVEEQVPEGPRDRMAERWTRPARLTESVRAERDEGRLDLGASSKRQASERSRERHSRQARRSRNALYPRRPLQQGERFFVTVDGERAGWAKLDPEHSLAESTARLIDLHAPSPLGPAGLLEGWYRPWQGDAAWYGDVRTAVLDPDTPIDLLWVDNSLAEVVVELEDREPVQVEVGTTVAVRFLTAWLRRVHDLPGRHWHLWAGDRRLDPWQILDDFTLDEGFRLALRHA